MNILLLYPEFPDTFWSFKHALRFVRRKSVSPPLGLLTVAAMLPADWHKRLVDLNITDLTPEDLAWADYAFISAMTVQRDAAQAIITRCKTAGLTIVAGGPLFTVEQEAFESVDHLILNEAELTLPPFLRDLAAGRAEHVYETSEFADLSQSPVPLWELVDMKRYATMNIQFSRGCPFNCDFCNVTALLGHMPRTKDVAQIIAELDTLYQQGWREGIFFVDDNLIGNKRQLKSELLPALIQWQQDKTGLTFSTEISINLADDEQLMDMMVEAGFTSVFIGIETPSDEGLAECSKKQNLHRNLVADVKRIQRAGLQVQGGFIVGFDSDTASIFQRQISFIQNSGVVMAMVGLLQAPPGTRLYQRLKSEGRLLEKISGNNVDGTTNVLTRMSLEKLHEGYRHVLSTIYAPDAYYQRIRTFLQEYRPPRLTTPLNREAVFAFLRSIYHLGIIGKERMQYWRLLVWTLIRRPRSFPMAVTLAIYGYHFRKICEQVLNPVPYTISR